MIKMQILATVVAIVILAFGVALSQSRNTFVEQNLSKNEQEKITPGESNSQENNQKKEEVSSTPIPTTTKKVIENNNNNDYIYPGSKIISILENSFVLESSDNADEITDWYKEKIKKKGLNVTTFVVTKTNNNVLNKLVGANKDERISVEIEQKTSDSKVTIRVVF